MRLLALLLLLFCDAAFGAAVAGADHWQVRARLDVEHERLRVDACGGRDSVNQRFVAGAGAAALLRDASRSSGKPLQRRGRRLIAADWQAGECLRTEIDLAAAARADRYGLGGRAGSYYRLSLRRWWWRPAALDPESRLRFELPTGWLASVPWVIDAAGGYRLGATAEDWPATTAWGRFEQRRLTVGASVLQVSLLPTAALNRLQKDELFDWIEHTARLLSVDGARWPLPSAQVLLVPLPGVRSPVPWGEVTRGGGPAVHLFIGADAAVAARRADWTAAHEFAHLQHPFLGLRGRWLAEGLGSYQQNRLRAAAGDFSDDEAWRRIAAGFERGRRATRAGEASLEQVASAYTRGSTMRVYWAGAAFWLESELALRATGGSLDRVLAEFARQHLPSEHEWTPEDYAAALDRLAPGAGFAIRLRRYAQGRDWPDSDALLTRVRAISAGD